MVEQVGLCFVAHGELARLFIEPDAGSDHCPRILLSCFRARTSDRKLSPKPERRPSSSNMTRNSDATMIQRGPPAHKMLAKCVVLFFAAAAAVGDRGGDSQYGRMSFFKRMGRKQTIYVRSTGVIYDGTAGMYKTFVTFFLNTGGKVALNRGSGLRRFSATFPPILRG